MLSLWDFSYYHKTFYFFSKSFLKRPKSNNWTEGGIETYQHFFLHHQRKCYHPEQEKSCNSCTMNNRNRIYTFILFIDKTLSLQTSISII